MAEKAIVKKVLEELRKRGIAEKIHGGPFQTAGLPDVIGCVQGLFIGIECKDGEAGGDPTPIQLYWGSEIVKNGGLWAVIRDRAELTLFLAALDEKLAVRRIMAEEGIRMHVIRRELGMGEGGGLMGQSR